MSRLCFVCLLLIGAGFAGAAPVPSGGLPVAPAPHAADPDASLILVGYGPDDARPATMRVLRIGVRKGRVRPVEVVWEGPARFLSYGGGHRIVANRYLVTRYGGVLDLAEKKVICPEMQGHLLAVDGPKVVYRLVGTERNDGIYAFDLLKREDYPESKLGVGKYGRPGHSSPDGTKSVEESAAGLTLHRDGKPPKLLGDGFTVQGGGLGRFHNPVPVLWLDDERVLTQTKNGVLVTVTVEGKKTPVVTIDAEKSPPYLPTLTRDPGGRVIYTCGGVGYAIDVKAGKAAKCEWVDLGHGFEASWTADVKTGHTVRHNGRKIGSWKGYPEGRTPTWPHDPMRVATTADHIAVVTSADGSGQPDGMSIRIWSASAGEWSGLKLWPNCLVGWVK